MLRRRFLTVLLVFGCIVGPGITAAPPPADADVEREFTDTVKPFLNWYCTSCHSGEKAAAQLDLRQYSSAESVVQDFCQVGSRAREARRAANAAEASEAARRQARQQVHQLDRRHLEDRGAQE